MSSRPAGQIKANNRLRGAAEVVEGRREDRVVIGGGRVDVLTHAIIPLSYSSLPSPLSISINGSVTGGASQCKRPSSTRARGFHPTERCKCVCMCVVRWVGVVV